MNLNWTKVSDALPTEYGTYLVVRGHWHMGVMDYRVAVADFHPQGWQHDGNWFDRGFVYTHWYGPVAKPEMDLKEFPILCEDPEKPKCQHCANGRPICEKPCVPYTHHHDQTLLGPSPVVMPCKTVAGKAR
jgi:hypothetical protein